MRYVRKAINYGYSSSIATSYCIWTGYSDWRFNTNVAVTPLGASAVCKGKYAYQINKSKDFNNCKNSPVWHTTTSNSYTCDFDKANCGDFLKVIRNYSLLTSFPSFLQIYHSKSAWPCLDMSLAETPCPASLLLKWAHTASWSPGRSQSRPTSCSTRLSLNCRWKRQKPSSLAWPAQQRPRRTPASLTFSTKGNLSDKSFFAFIVFMLLLQCRSAQLVGSSQLSDRSRCYPPPKCFGWSSCRHHRSQGNLRRREEHSWANDRRCSHLVHALHGWVEISVARCQARRLRLRVSKFNQTHSNKNYVWNLICECRTLFIDSIV